MKISSATPVLFVERVEPTRDFFKRVGFEGTVEVPDGDKLGSSYAVLDGRDDALLQWITEAGFASLIADNYGVEAVPSRPGGPTAHAGLPLHQHCLFKLGVNLGEMWYLTELATWLRQHKRNRFLLTAPPLRLTGAVGSPATPIATV